MFSGVTHLSFDAKNRLAIPVRYRDNFIVDGKIRAVITLDSPKCLLIYPENTWNLVRNKIFNLSTSVHPLIKSYQRLILGHAEVIDADKIGRILIPSNLKKATSLLKDVILVGMGNRFELWDKIKFNEEIEKALKVKQEDLVTLLNDFTL